MLPQYPEIMPLPIAQNGNKNTIPLTTETAGLLTYNEGFPPITQVSVKAGGKAPQRLDFNGAFYALSQHLFFLQAGGQYQWSAELDYNVGAVIQGSDNNQYLALQVSGPSVGGSKDPTVEENAAYWKKINFDLVQSIRESEDASTDKAPSEKAVANALKDKGADVADVMAAIAKVQNDHNTLENKLTDSYISGLGMPSARYIDYSPVANKISTVTAPANGYFCQTMRLKGGSGVINMNVKKNAEDLAAISSYVNLVVGASISVYLPVGKGDIVTYFAGNESGARYDVHVLRFFYAQGEI